MSRVSLTAGLLETMDDALAYALLSDGVGAHKPESELLPLKGRGPRIYARARAREWIAQELNDRNERKLREALGFEAHVPDAAERAQRMAKAARLPHRSKK